jgi:prepilin-type N-terminal cleavage/methylation domain-containing protein
MKNTNTRIRGFTLVEMMVVIAIIAILTAIIVTNFSGAKGKARDAKRISDMGQIQLALELYFDRCNMYPSPTIEWAVGQGGDSAQCNRTKTPGGSDYYTMEDFMANIPRPTGEKEQTNYGYVTNNDRTDYVLHAVLESTNAIVSDGLTAVPNDSSWTIGDFGNADITCGGNSLPDHVDYCLGPK